jgi:YVTN family beta-propeller protein
VSVISDSTDTVVATVSLGSDPDGLTWDSAKDEVFVAEAGGTNVSVISGATNQVVETVAVGSYPFGVAYDGGKGEIFVSDVSSNDVSVINDTTNGAVATIPVLAGPAAIAYDRESGEIYVVSNGPYPNYYDNVSVISDATNQVVTTFPVGSSPEGIAYDDDSGNAYVCNTAQGTLSIISPGASTVTFTETGLPSGAEWYLNVTGETPVSSTTGSATIDLANGPYAYSIASTNKEYEPFPAAGTFPVAGTPLSESVTFQLVTYPLSFMETGLPADTNWSVTLNGTAQSSMGSTTVFTERNGTYSFALASAAGYTITPASGSIALHGHPISEPITFTSNSTPPGHGLGSGTFLGLSATVGWGLLGGVVAAVIVGVGAVILRRRRGNASPDSSPSQTGPRTPPPPS